MPKHPITEAEREIMELLWQQSPQTADDMIRVLGPKMDWKPGTIKTLINRLLVKKVISAERDGRRFLYTAATSRESCVSKDGQRFLDRWFDGRLAPFVAHLSETDQLDARDIDDLRQLIQAFSDQDETS